MMRPGRPSKLPSAELLNHSGRYYIKMATFFIDMVALLIYPSGVGTESETLDQIIHKLLMHVQRTEKIREEMKQVITAYTKFLDLKRELEDRRKRMEQLIAVLGPKMFRAAVGEDVWATSDIFDFVDAEELRKSLPLWRAVETIIEIEGKSRVPDIQHLLRILGIKNVTRQAIESALNRHPETFKITKKDRERYIELKKK